MKILKDFFSSCIYRQFRFFYGMVLVSFWRYPDPDPYHLKWIRIRIRPNDMDPTGSGSGSTTLVFNNLSFNDVMKRVHMLCICVKSLGFQPYLLCTLILLKINCFLIMNLLHGRFIITCLLYTSPSPRDMRRSRMPSSA